MQLYKDKLIHHVEAAAEYDAYVEGNAASIEAVPKLPLKFWGRSVTCMAACLFLKKDVTVVEANRGGDCCTVSTYVYSEVASPGYRGASQVIRASTNVKEAVKQSNVVVMYDRTRMHYDGTNLKGKHS
jgi:hypothetical protein